MNVCLLATGDSLIVDYQTVHVLNTMYQAEYYHDALSTVAVHKRERESEREIIGRNVEAKVGYECRNLVVTRYGSV